MISLILVLMLQLPVQVEFKSPEYLDSIAPKFDRAPIGAVFTQQSYKAWNFLGPMPITGEPWSQGNVSGRVTSIAIDPTDPNTVYITGAQGGVWKTTDGGNTWTPLTDDLSSLASGYITIDPTNNLTLYYGTGELHFCGDCYFGDGLFKSTDGGESWTKIATTSQVGSRISKIVVNSSHPNVIYVGNNGGVSVSWDGGVSWNYTISGAYCNDVEVNPTNPNIVYASFWGYGIYKSTDAGSSWVHLTTGLPAGGFTRIELAVSPSNGDVIYASFASTSYDLLGLYKSIDGGDNWTQLSGTPDYLYPQGFYDHCIIVDPADPNIVYAGGVFPYNASYHGLVMTTDGGSSWSDITIASNGTRLHPDIQTLAIGPDGTLWVGCDGGVWKTTNPGASWTNLNYGLGISQFYSVGLHPTRPDSLLGGTQDNGTPLYYGNLSWSEVSGGDGGPCLFDWYDPGYYFTTYIKLQDIYLYHNGAYQDDIAGPWVSSGDRVSWANAPLVMDPQNHNVIYAGTFRVWRTTDYGSTWDSISVDLTGGSGVLLSLAIAPSNTSIIYTGSSDGKVYKSTDWGSTWSEIDGSTFGTSGITDIVVNPSNPDEVYLSVKTFTGGRVYKTTDGGANWTDISGDLPSNLRGLSLAVDFSTPEPQLYLGTDYGVYFSANGGVNWSQPLDGLPDVAIYEIKIDTANDYVVAATHGRGMWRTQLISTSVGENSVTASKINVSHLSLNGVLKVSNLNPSENYSVRIYSVTGRLMMRKNVSGMKESRIQTNLPTGMYFVRVTGKRLDKVFKLEIIR